MTIALGPSSALASASIPAFLSAMRVRLFLTTRYSLLKLRIFCRISLNSTVFSPLKEVTISPLHSRASFSRSWIAFVFCSVGTFAFLSYYGCDGHRQDGRHSGDRAEGKILKSGDGKSSR